MRNSEGYRDPTAGKAMNPKPKRQKQIVGPPAVKQIKKNIQMSKPKTVYYAKPAYVAK